MPKQKIAWTPIDAQYMDQGPVENEPGFLITLSASNANVDKKSVTSLAIGIGQQSLEWMEINFPDVLEESRIRIAYAIPLQLNIQLNFIKQTDTGYLDAFSGTQTSNTILTKQATMSSSVSSWVSKVITSSGIVNSFNIDTYSSRPDINIEQLVTLTDDGWIIMGVDTITDAPLSGELGCIFTLKKVDKTTSVITSYGNLTKALIDNSLTLPEEQIALITSTYSNVPSRMSVSLQATMIGILGSTIVTQDLQPTFLQGTKSSIPSKIASLISSLSLQVVTSLY